MSFRAKIKDQDNNNNPSAKADGAHDNSEQTAEEIAEIVAEEAGAAVLPELQAELDDLRAQLEAARRSVEEEHNQYLRALADFANFKRRKQEEFETYAQFASHELILQLLPIIDNFERALQAAQENQNFDALANGVSLTLRQLHDFLDKQQIQPIEAVGREFDPTLHEAVMRVESENHPDNTIVEELEKGYTQKSRVIRPSRVTVAMRPPVPEPDEE